MAKPKGLVILAIGLIGAAAAGLIFQQRSAR
jgi:hypothetical protein